MRSWDSTINVDGQDFDSSAEYFIFDGYHEIHNQAELKKLRLFKRLSGASFGGSNLNDDGLDHVCSVPTIENLDLQDTRVSNAGLAHLARLPGLKHLRLKENDQLTNDCVAHPYGSAA